MSLHHARQRPKMRHLYGHRVYLMPIYPNRSARRQRKARRMWLKRFCTRTGQV